MAKSYYAGKNYPRLVCIFFILNLIFITPVSAGLFSVTPVRVYMAPKDRAAAITIENTGDEELVMQADLYEWKQKANGEDDLTLTEDLFLAPPIIKMAPKSRQVVRLAKLNPAKTGRQLTYRMIVREIPEAKAITQDINVKIALAFSIPVFITPPDAKAKLVCTVERVAEDTIKAICENSGSAYAQPRDFRLTNMTGEKIVSREQGGYILAGLKRSFEIKREAATIPSGPAKLSLLLDDGAVQTYDVTVP